MLRVSLSKGDGNEGEKPLGDLSLERFSLWFGLATSDMNVIVKLSYGCFIFPYYTS